MKCHIVASFFFSKNKPMKGHPADDDNVQQRHKQWGQRFQLQLKGPRRRMIRWRSRMRQLPHTMCHAADPQFWPYWVNFCDIPLDICVICAKKGHKSDGCQVPPDRQEWGKIFADLGLTPCQGQGGGHGARSRGREATNEEEQESH